MILPFLAVLTTVWVQTGIVGISLSTFLLVKRRIAYLLLYALQASLNRRVFNGDHQPSAWFRSSAFWRKYAEYFQAELVKTSELSPHQPYLIGCHPHGILALSGACMWGSEATGFSEKFPGIARAIGVVNFGFMCPVAREFATGTGCISANRKSVMRALQSGTSVVLYPGGAVEALVAGCSEGVKVVLRDRLGFVKVAVETGAALVPAFTFGENDAFEQVTNAKLRQAQIKLMSVLGFSLPLLKPYSTLLPIFPKQVKLTTVVGTPLNVVQMSKTDPRFEDEVKRLHELYMQELQKLHSQFKGRYGSASEQELSIIDAEAVKSYGTRLSSKL